MGLRATQNAWNFRLKSCFGIKRREGTAVPNFLLFLSLNVEIECAGARGTHTVNNRVAAKLPAG